MVGNLRRWGSRHRPEPAWQPRGWPRIVADVGLAAVGVVVEHAGLINDAGADQVVGGGVGTLHDGVGNIVTVDGQAQSLTDIDIVERLTLVVQGDVVGAQDGVNIEVAAVLSLGQAGDLIGGDVLDELCLTAVVSGVGALESSSRSRVMVSETILEESQPPT